MRSIFAAAFAAIALTAPACAQDTSAPAAAPAQVAQPQNGATPDASRVTVAPGYTLDLASGWSACDPQMNMQAGGPPLADYFQKMCLDPPKEMTVPIIKPELGGFSVLMVGSETDGQTAQEATDVDRAKLQAIGDKLCQSTDFAGMKIAQCAFEVTTVAGRMALNGTIQTPGDNGLTMKMRAIVFPEPGRGMTMLIFARAALGQVPDHFGEDPDVDAMIDSLQSQ